MSNNMIIIGVTGRKRSGKDTIGKYLVENHGFTRVAFADSLKEACKIIFGFSDEQVYGDELKEVIDEYWNHSPREILQKVGTELFRDQLPRVCGNIGDDIWIRSVERQINNLRKQGHQRFVITDVRFENELNFIKKQKNGYVWKVIRGKRKQCEIDKMIEGKAIEDTVTEDTVTEDKKDKAVEVKENMHQSEALIDQFETDTVIINNFTKEELYEMVEELIQIQYIANQSNDYQSIDKY